MNQKTFKYIVGKNSIVNAAKDSDKDGVMDIVDCDPKDPNKQGWIHDKFEKWKTERAERKVKEVEFKRQAQEAGDKKYAEERVRYLKQKAEQSAIARARAPSVGEQLQGIVKSFQTAKPAVRTAKVPKRYSDKNRDGVPDIFAGTPNLFNVKKKGKGGIPRIF